LNLFYLKMTEDEKKSRVTRYCPKLDKIKFELKCEWDKCNYLSTDMDDYLKHIENEHLNSKTIDKTNNKSNSISPSLSLI
jgi:hypothetical protein